MELWVAVVLLIFSVCGIILSAIFLKAKKTLRILLIICFSLIAIVLAGYIGLTAVFLDAASNKPPDL